MAKTKTIKLDKNHTIEYDKVELNNVKESDEIVVDNIDECMELQKSKYIVVNVYRENGIKKYVLVKNK